MTPFIPNTDHHFLRDATEAHNRLAEKVKVLTGKQLLAQEAYRSVYAVYNKLLASRRCPHGLEVEESGRMVFRSPKQLGLPDDGQLAYAYCDLAVRISEVYVAYGDLNSEYLDTARCVRRLSLEARWDRDVDSGRAVTYTYQQWILLRHNLIVLSDDIREATALVLNAMDSVNEINRFSRGYNPISMLFAKRFPKFADPEWVSNTKKEFGLTDPEIRPMKGCV